MGRGTGKEVGRQREEKQEGKGKKITMLVTINSSYDGSSSSFFICLFNDYFPATKVILRRTKLKNRASPL